VAGIGLGLAILEAAGMPLRGSANQAAVLASPAQATTWVTTNGTVVNLSLIAGWNNVNVGFNFNGAAHGQMTVTIPLGDKVNVTFTNKAKGVPHNAEIIPFTTNPIAGRVNPPAFPGAETPAPRFRPGQGGGFPGGASKPLTFSFVAGKAGKYMIICAISGHALAGMWDNLVVSNSLKTASVAFTK
jgi:sulfocyanin